MEGTREQDIEGPPPPTVTDCYATPLRLLNNIDIHPKGNNIDYNPTHEEQAHTHLPSSKREKDSRSRPSPTGFTTVVVDLSRSAKPYCSLQPTLDIDQQGPILKIASGRAHSLCQGEVFYTPILA